MESTEEPMETQDKMDDSSPFQLYRLNTPEGSHTLLQAPATVEKTHSEGSGSHDVMNVLMVDVSGSMSSSLRFVHEGWNTYVAERLFGSTRLYTFSNDVLLIGEQPAFKESLRTRGTTNISAALTKINEVVLHRKESSYQIFIVTDGAHTEGSPYPEDIVAQLRVPNGKVVHVFLLGVSNCFPVNLSIDIRSRLHNGAANLPSLYWAKDGRSDILEQMAAIATNLGKQLKMELSHEGYIIPHLPSTKTMHPGEWLYFPRPPEEMAGLKVKIGDVEEKEIPSAVKEATSKILVNDLFPQWNSVLIRQHRNKEKTPKEVLTLMDSLFERNIKMQLECKTGGIKERLEKKSLKQLETNYRTLTKTVRNIIEVEGKYANEIELANNILKSTVSGLKYDTQVLKLRGHGLDDYEKDKKEFFTLYKKLKAAIQELPVPHPDECCRITMSSTLSDLQDDNFLMMEDSDKFEVLQTFTMSGIPAYAPVRDAAKINSWTLAINHILVTPFTVLSQRAIEAFAGVEGEDSLGSVDKDVKLKADDETSRFNIVIPTIPASAASVLKPIVRSKFYAMMATFSILKDPHIVDHSAHLAALACAWLKSVAEHPPTSRPTYITERLAAIAATAEIYMDRQGIMQYLNALSNDPSKALITEYTDPTTSQTTKCESLVKPPFLLGMSRAKFTMAQLVSILKLLLLEFIGRCLSNYKVNKPDATPFTDFFVPELSDYKEKDKWFAKQSESLIEEYKLSCGSLLKKFYTPENLKKGFNEFCSAKKTELGGIIKKSFTLAVNMKKVKHLKYIGGCGDVTFDTFPAWALEMGIPEEEILAATDPSKQVFVYVYHALRYRNSKERQQQQLASYEETLNALESEVVKENEKTFFKHLEKQSTSIVEQWTKEYMTAHEPLVMPLTPQQVVSQAQTLNVDVTEETFSKVYRYNSNTGLLFNACMVSSCPYYLLPNRSFNQHLSVERTLGNYPHALHLVSKARNSEGVDGVMDLVISGEYSGHKGRKKYEAMTETSGLQKLKPEIEELVKMYGSMPA